jgi:hypothetical protein
VLSWGCDDGRVGRIGQPVCPPQGSLSNQPKEYSAMKVWFHVALALLVGAGFVQDATVGADPIVFDFDVGCASAPTTDPIFHETGCEGIKAHFEANPIPLEAIDISNGKEIIGWEIHCPVEVSVSAGTMTGPGPSRRVFRTFGWIEVKYAE